MAAISAKHSNWSRITVSGVDDVTTSHQFWSASTGFECVVESC